MNEWTRHLYSRVMLLALLLTASAVSPLLWPDPSNMDTLSSELILVSGVAFG